ncbi:transposable element Tc3 transposase [Trichonephila clavipes]|nr:transposable element Tc3 transposase [Trichonephila clavipes]
MWWVWNSCLGRYYVRLPYTSTLFDTGSVTAQRYKDDIFEPRVRLFRGAIGQDFIFMDDNVKPHRANLVEVFLEEESIFWVEWPAKSPDLNPIEHIWDTILEETLFEVNALHRRARR